MRCMDAAPHSALPSPQMGRSPPHSSLLATRCGTSECMFNHQICAAHSKLTATAELNYGWFLRSVQRLPTYPYHDGG
jgi:hypothetical protein